MMRLRTILHPTDFSECSQAALELAGALAHDYCAKLVILHVTPTPLPVTTAGLVETIVPLDLGRLRQKLKGVRPSQADVRVQHMLVEGEPVGEEILRVAERSKCEMITMGTHGRRALRRLVLGSIAEGVSRRAPCPVLTTRNFQKNVHSKRSVKSVSAPSVR
jgi:nucleotide-binding universal stress UspA family protein